MSGQDLVRKLPEISEREALLRRVPPSFFPSKEGPHKPALEAFLPRRWRSVEDPGDATGLSVNRESFTTIDAVAKHPDTGEQQNVARTQLQQIRSLDLTAVADELPHDLSHALIPELNSLDYKNNKEKKRWIKVVARKIALELCELAFVCPASASPRPPVR